MIRECALEISSVCGGVVWWQLTLTMLARTVLVLALAAVAAAEITWVNDYDEPFLFECPENFVIFHISVY